MSEEIQREKLITCPSGLTGIVRKLKLKEMDAMASRDNLKKGISVDKMLSGVWLHTEDVGIYHEPFVKWKESEKGILPNWSQVLAGDRDFILIELRKMSARGSSFDFPLVCNATGCKKRFDYHIDLEEIPITGLSEEATNQLAETGENIFFRDLPFSGDKVGFKLFTGADQSIASKQQPDEKIFSTNMLLRLPYIAEARGPSERRKFCEEMDADDAEWLKAQWEEADITIENEIEVECKHCYHIQDRVLPFDAGFFWQRSSQKKKTSES